MAPSPQPSESVLSPITIKRPNLKSMATVNTQKYNMDSKVNQTQMNTTLKFTYGKRSIINTKLNKRTFEHDGDGSEIESIKSSEGMVQNENEVLKDLNVSPGDILKITAESPPRNNLPTLYLCLNFY